MNFLQTIILFILSFWVLSITAQSNSDIAFYRQFKLEDGLTSNLIECVYKDSRGLLWIGTNDNGLCVYDGSTFHPYPLIAENDNLTKPYTGVIHGLVEDEMGRMWITTEVGVYIVSVQDNKNTLLYFPENNALGLKSCNSISRGADKKMYITIGSTFDLITVDNTLKVDSCSFNHIKNISDLVIDDSQNIWFSHWDTGQSLYKLNSNNHSISSKSIPSHIDLEGNMILVKLGAGEVILIPRVSGDLYQVNLKSMDMFDYNNQTYLIDKTTISNIQIESFISDVFFDKNGVIWLATKQGLYLIQATIRNSPFKTVETLSGQSLRLISEIQDSLFFISFSNGFYELNLKTNEFHLLNKDISVCNLTPLPGDSLLLNILGKHHFVYNQKTKKVHKFLPKEEKDVDTHHSYASIKDISGVIKSGSAQLVGIDSLAHIRDCNGVEKFKDLRVNVYVKDINHVL